MPWFRWTGRDYGEGLVDIVLYGVYQVEGDAQDGGGNSGSGGEASLLIGVFQGHLSAFRTHRADGKRVEKTKKGVIEKMDLRRDHARPKHESNQSAYRCLFRRRAIGPFEEFSLLVQVQMTILLPVVHLCSGARP